MVEVIFYLDNSLSGDNPEKRIVEVKGHSGFAKKGNDIVCSAVSILIQTYVYSLYKHAGVVQAIESNGERYVSFFERYYGKKDRVKIKSITETVLSGFELLVKEYPDNIRLVVVEKGVENGS